MIARRAAWPAAPRARRRRFAPASPGRPDWSRCPRRRASRRLGLRRRARRRGPLAAPAPAALARAGIGQQHRGAAFRLGALEGAPPFLELGRYLAARRAQREEVVR